MRVLNPNLSFNFTHDLAPVGGVMRIRTHPRGQSVAAGNSVPELIAYAKAHPDKLNMASGGDRSGAASRRRAVQDDDRHQHVACALSRRCAGDHRLTRPTSGGSVRHACLVSGVHQNRQLRALGITTAKRSEALPDLPAIDDSVKGYEESSSIRKSPHRRARPPMSSKSSTRRSTRPWSTRI